MSLINEALKKVAAEDARREGGLRPPSYQPPVAMPPREPHPAARAVPGAAVALLVALGMAGSMYYVTHSSPSTVSAAPTSPPSLAESDPSSIPQAMDIASGITSPASEESRTSEGTGGTESSSVSEIQGIPGVLSPLMPATSSAAATMVSLPGELAGPGAGAVPGVGVSGGAGVSGGPSSSSSGATSEPGLTFMAEPALPVAAMVLQERSTTAGRMPTPTSSPTTSAGLANQAATANADVTPGRPWQSLEDLSWVELPGRGRLTLTAVARSPVGARAVINGRIVAEGEQVSDATVLSIGDKDVQLLITGERFTLTLP